MMTDSLNEQARFTSERLAKQVFIKIRQEYEHAGGR